MTHDSRRKLRIVGRVLGTLTGLASLPYLVAALVTITVEELHPSYIQACIALGVALILLLGLVISTAATAFAGKSKVGATLAGLGLFAGALFVVTHTWEAAPERSRYVQPRPSFLCGSAHNAAHDDAVDYAISIDESVGASSIRGEVRRGEERWTVEEGRCTSDNGPAYRCGIGEGRTVWFFNEFTEFHSSGHWETAHNHHIIDVVAPHRSTHVRETYNGWGVLARSCDPDDVRDAEEYRRLRWGWRLQLRVWYQHL